MRVSDSERIPELLFTTHAYNSSGVVFILYPDDDNADNEELANVPVNSHVKRRQFFTAHWSI